VAPGLVLVHVTAAFAVLAAPWVGCIGSRRARKRIAEGRPGARVRLYRQTVVEQVVTTGVVLALWASGRIPAASLGLVAPRSWAWNVAAFVVVVGALVWSGLQLRPKAAKIRERVKGGVGALIPESNQERFWFGWVSVGAGISEELLFRGFLLYYFSMFVPQMNTTERVLLASLCFGLGHLYQGWKGVVGTGIVGLVVAGLYLMTGSLLLPVLIHAALDSRVLLIFPPETPAAIAVEGNA
jgi:membrane protease YdiL (CAAX protease family)